MPHAASVAIGIYTLCIHAAVHRLNWCNYVYLKTITVAQAAAAADEDDDDEGISQRWKL